MYYCVLNIITIAMGNPSFGVPERLKLEVAIANEALEAERWVWSPLIAMETTWE